MTPTSTAGQQQQQQQWHQQQQVAQDRNVFCYLLFVVVQRHSSHVSAMSVWGVSSVVVRACGQAKIHYTESIFISSAECRHYGSTSSSSSSNSGSSSQLVWHLNVARGLFDFCFNHWASHLPMWLSSCPCLPFPLSIPSMFQLKLRQSVCQLLLHFHICFQHFIQSEENANEISLMQR